MFQPQQQQQERVKKIQQKIKMMIKNKKMHKLNSEKDIALSEKPISIQNQRFQNKIDEIQSIRKKNILLNQEQQNNSSEQNSKTYSYKRMKSTMAELEPISSGSLYQREKNNILDQNSKDLQNQSELDKKTPSLQKLVKLKQKISKRPSSVVNKSHRLPTSRIKIKKVSQPLCKKQLQDRLRKCIEKVFVYGTKLQKFCEQKKLNIEQEQQKLFSQQIKILKLISQCKKITIDKCQNDQESEDKILNFAQQQIIDLLKKNREKEKVISNCERIYGQISNLIQSRLNALNKSKVINQ